VLQILKLRKHAPQDQTGQMKNVRILPTVSVAGLIWILLLQTMQRLPPLGQKSTSKADMCANGHLQLRRTHLWRYIDGKSPAIADVLTSDDKLYVVINLKVLENHRTASATLEWQTASWTFTFVNYSIPSLNATSFGIMKDPNVLILYAVLPPTLLLVDPKHAMHINITARLPQRTHTYDSVPFCLIPASELPGPTYQLAACIKCIPDEASLL
jgi:hypothetical protein